MINTKNKETTYNNKDPQDQLCVTHVQKNFLNSSFIKQLLTKYQIFTILPQISHFHKYRNFSSIFATF